MRRTDQPLRHRKARDRALILPVIGAILLLPPIARIFAIDAGIGGVPLPVIYVFAVWAALIVGAAALSRHLGGPEPVADDAESGKLD
jgi:hypothetical protein